AGVFLLRRPLETEAADPIRDDFEPSGPPDGAAQVENESSRCGHGASSSRRCLPLECSIVDDAFSLGSVPVFSRLDRSRAILIAGAGGGFDVFAALPLYLALRAQGKVVHLANLTFTDLRGTNVSWPALHVAAVTASTTGQDGYFPERRLAEWFA